MANYSTVPSSACTCKALSYGEKIVKIGPVYPEIFDEIRRTTTSTCNAISISQFSAETTGPIFTKFLHNIVALVALLNPAHTRRYLIPFLNARVTKMGSLPFFAQNRLPWQHPLRFQKKGPDRSSTAKKLSFDVKIVKIGPADLQIICLREIKEGKIYSPVGRFAERAKKIQDGRRPPFWKMLNAKSQQPWQILV